VIVMEKVDYTTDAEQAAYWKGAYERMSARNITLSEAIKPFADLGIGSGPDDQQDSYKIEYGAIRSARSAIEGR
jgi:hypothetical protein